MMAGRPLRFLVATLGGWTAIRVALLWPTIDSLPALIRAIVPPAAADVADRPPPEQRMARIVPAALAFAPRPTAPAAAPRLADPTRIALALASLVRYGHEVPVDDSAPGTQVTTIPPPLRPADVAQGPGRLAGSAWLIARGGANGTLSGGQLGGSQAGARLTYALDAGRHLALAARFATPLEGRGKEAAIGIDWQPTRLPIHVIAEQRFALDGGRGGPTAMIVGGFGPTPVAQNIRAEAYGQAGVIARNGGEGFGDGAARVTHALPDTGRTRIDIGAGTWGAVQRGAARLDVGPTVGLTVPLAAKALRITLDWRQRVAGDARPGSGPALSIGSDF